MLRCSPCTGVTVVVKFGCVMVGGGGSVPCWGGSSQGCVRTQPPAATEVEFTPSRAAPALCFQSLYYLLFNSFLPLRTGVWMGFEKGIYALGVCCCCCCCWLYLFNLPRLC